MGGSNNTGDVDPDPDLYSYVEPELDPTSLDLILYGTFGPEKCLLCSSFRKLEPEPFLEKVGARVIFKKKSHTAPQH